MSALYTISEEVKEGIGWQIVETVINLSMVSMLRRIKDSDHDRDVYEVVVGGSTFSVSEEEYYKIQKKMRYET